MGYNLPGLSWIGKIPGTHWLGNIPGLGEIKGEPGGLTSSQQTPVAPVTDKIAPPALPAPVPLLASQDVSTAQAAAEKARKRAAAGNTFAGGPAVKVGTGTTPGASILPRTLIGS